MSTRYFAATSPFAPENLGGWWFMECFDDGSAYIHYRNGTGRQTEQLKYGKRGWAEIYVEKTAKGGCFELTWEEMKAALSRGWNAWLEDHPGAAVATGMEIYGDAW